MEIFLSFWLILCILCLIILYLKLNDSQKSYVSLVREHQSLSDSNALLNSTLDSLHQSETDLRLEHEASLLSLQQDLNSALDAHKKLLSQKKSSEVRLGNIAEKLVPFLDYFKFEPENAVFLGQPIDYVVFEEDGVTFVEIKSGKSQLSAKQRRIRDLIKDKQVFWQEIRIN